MDESGRSELDRAFVRYVSRRDPGDLAMVFDGAAAKLLLVGMHLLGDVAAAEDLLQATFLDAIRGAAGFDSKRPVMPWLLSILTHRAGKVQRCGSGLNRDRAAEDLDTLPSGEREPSVKVSEREVITEIVAAVEGLSRPYREVLLLRLVHDLPPAEIAHTLDRKIGTVHVQLHRGLARLRAILPKSLAGVLALVIGAERGLAAVRQRVIDEACRQMLPVMGTLAGGLLMKKVLAAVAMVLVLLAMGAWLLIGVEGEGIGTDMAAPTMVPVTLGVGEILVDEEERSLDLEKARKLATTATSQISFTGRVVAAESGVPIVGAEVRLTFYAYGILSPDTSDWKTPPAVISAADGRFAIAIDYHDLMGIELWIKFAGRVEAMGSNIDLRGGLTHDVGDVKLYVGSKVGVRVIDEDGMPVEGHNVVYRKFSHDPIEKWNGLLGLRSRNGLDDVWALTDAQGRLPVALLYPGMWKIKFDFPFVRPMGFEFVGPAEFSVRFGDAPREIVVRVKRASLENRISGRVVDVLGQPMPYFELDITYKGRKMGYLPFRSRHDGSFASPNLSADSGLVMIRPGEWLGHEFVDPPSPMSIGVTDLKLVVRKIEKVPVTVDVVDEFGNEVEGFEYRCVPVRTKEGPDGVNTWQVQYNSGSKEITDPSVHGRHSGGGLSLKSIVFRRYFLYVRGDDPRFAPLQAMSIEARSKVAQARTMVLEEVCVWQVRVVDDQGAPTSGSRVELIQPFGENEVRLNHRTSGLDAFFARGWDGTNHLTADAITDERGIVTIHSTQTLEGAALRVTGAGHQPLLVSIDAAAPRDQPLEIVVARAAQIEGAIGPLDIVLSWGVTEAKRREFALKTTCAEGIASRMPTIVVYRPGEDFDRRALGTARIDQQGRFRLESLAPGDWNIYFNGGFETTALHLRYLIGSVRDLKTGEVRQAEFSIPELDPARIAGTIFVDGEAPIDAELVLHGPVSAYIAIDHDGRFQSKLLPPGRYTADLKGKRLSDAWRIDAKIPIEVALGETTNRILRFNK